MTNNPPQLKDLEIVFGNLVNVLLALGAFALFIMLLSGGFKYLTSGGDQKALEGAKKTLTLAIGGFVLFIASYLILQIIGRFTGTESIINKFQIKR